ncbi:MAG: hypothetical protein ACE5F1_18400, partial [Planctomycetota bacterium]
RDWRRLAPPTSPPPRWSGSIATDPLRKRVVLHGGSARIYRLNMFPLSDTWEWDGKTWTQSFPKTVPAKRFGAGFAFCAKSGRSLLFGGKTSVFSTAPTESWEWDGLDWRKLSPSINPPGYGPMAPVPGKGTVLMFRGLYSANGQHTWEWDGRSWRDNKPPGFPSRRMLAVLAPDEVRGKVLLFGGDSGTRLHDTWSWNGSTWTKVADRQVVLASSVCHDPVRDEFLMAVPGNPLNWNAPFETWTMVEDRYQRKAPATSPRPRSGGGLVFHAGLQKAVFFGGEFHDPVRKYANDTWLWDGRTWAEHRSSSFPKKQGSPSMTYDSHRQSVVLVTHTGETWEWDATGWVMRAPKSRPPKGGMIAYDSARKRTVLFNGDLWEWNGQNWKKPAPQNRPSTTGHLMAYVPGLGGVVMFSGYKRVGTRLVPSPDTWLWDGTGWKQLAVPPLPVGAFGYPSMRIAAYDSRRQRLRAFSHSYTFREGAWDLFVESLTASQLYPRPSEALSFGIRLPGQARLPFLLALSQGLRPGIPLRPVPGVGIEMLPLKPDALFWSSLQLPLVVGLDGQGSGKLALRVPNDPALLWFGFHAAGLTFEAGGAVGAISNGVPIQIVK